MKTKTTLHISAALLLALAGFGWHGTAAAATVAAADPAALVAKLDALRRPSAANL